MRRHLEPAPVDMFCDRIAEVSVKGARLALANRLHQRVVRRLDQILLLGRDALAHAKGLQSTHKTSLRSRRMGLSYKDGPRESQTWQV